MVPYPVGWLICLLYGNKGKDRMIMTMLRELLSVSIKEVVRDGAS